MKKRFKIKNKLVVCFGAILVIGFIISGIMANQVFKKIIEESTLKNLSRLAKDTADKVNIILDEKQRVIEKLAKSPELMNQHFSIQEKLSVLSDLNFLLEFKEIAWVDLEGNIYGLEGFKRNIADTVEFKQALKGQVTVSSGIEAKDEILYAVIAPIMSESGQFIGAIMGMENIESLTYIVAENEISDAYMILDSKAEIVAYSNEGMLDRQKVISDMQGKEKFKHIYKKYENMLRGFNGTGYCIDPETGEKSYVSYAATDIGWSLVLFNQRSQLLGVLREFNYSLIVVTVIIIALGLVTVYLMAREMARRINGITHYLDTVANGDFEQPVPKNLLELEDEMGDAARALEGMKIEIEEMIDTIKRCTDYMNDQMEDLTDGIKDEIKSLLNSNELEDKERQDVIKRLYILNEIVDSVNHLGTNGVHQKEIVTKSYE